MKVYIIQKQIMNSTQNLQNLELSDRTQGVQLAFQDIQYDVQTIGDQGEKGRKKILHKINGIFKAGEVTAIMGASGAGKTTLLNIIACRIDNFQGKIYANEKQYNFETFGSFANYVMQGDILLQTMTVRQTLQFYAKLKVGSKEAAQEKLQFLAKRLKLQKCLDTLVGGALVKGVSGGEKKRTSIACELISDSSVIVLDQPTSGMDSLTSFIIVGFLRDLARQGKTVLLTIHQPNSQIFALFDSLMLLVEGRLIYQGSSVQAERYFANYFNLLCPQFQNPADFFMSIMHSGSQQNKERYNQYYDTYQKKISQQISTLIQNRNTSAIIPRIHQNGFYFTITILLKRDFLNILRNPIVMQSRIIQVLFIAIFTGGLYFNIGRKSYTQPAIWRAITGYLFFISMDLFMQALMPVPLTFAQQRSVFLKEQNSKLYTLPQYFLSRNIIQIPYMFIIPMLYLLVNYWMVGLANTAGQFFTMYFIIVVISFTATSIGLFIGSFFDNPKFASGLIPIFVPCLLAFSGMFKNYENIPAWIGWLRFLSPFNYNYTALVKNQCLFKESLIEQVNFQLGLWAAVLIELAVGIAFRLGSYAVLGSRKGKLQ